MNRSIVRCRCGHRVLAKEVLRTDLYERREPEGPDREYVYVKFRCQRCKRMGDAFVAESHWDRSILEPDRNEMNDIERDQFLDEDPISAEEILDFHRQLAHLSKVSDWSSGQSHGQDHKNHLPASREKRQEKGPAEKSGSGDSELPGGRNEAEHQTDEPPATFF